MEEFGSAGTDNLEVSKTGNEVNDKFIDTIYASIYDPGELEDKETVNTKFSGLIESDEDALKFSDNSEAIVIGAPTIGKGLGQTVDRDGKLFELGIPITDIDQSPINHRLVTDPSSNDQLANIQINTFNHPNLAIDLEAAIKQYPDVKGFIIDVRGAKSRQASHAASLFFSEGGRYADIVDKPISILSNQMSASSSQMLYNAQRNMDEAIVIGTPTFGKGLGQ